MTRFGRSLRRRFHHGRHRASDAQVRFTEQVTAVRSQLEAADLIPWDKD